MPDRVASAKCLLPKLLAAPQQLDSQLQGGRKACPGHGVRKAHEVHAKGMQKEHPAAQQP